MLQRGGEVVAKVVKDTTAKTLRTEIYKTVKDGSTIYSAEWSYGDLSDRYKHSYVYHCCGIYGMGDVTTNSIEGFWSILKRGIIGVYHKVSRKHLQKYVDEFSWRYAQRMLPLYQAFEMKKVNGVEIRQRLSDGYIDAVAIATRIFRIIPKFVSRKGLFQNSHEKQALKRQRCYKKRMALMKYGYTRRLP